MFTLGNDGRIYHLNDSELKNTFKCRRLTHRYQFSVHERIDAQLISTGFFKTTMTVTLIDISANGAAIYCQENLNVRQSFYLHFELDNGYVKKAIETKMNVIRKIAEHHYAIRFLERLHEVDLYGIHYDMTINERRKNTR